MYGAASVDKFIRAPFSLALDAYLALSCDVHTADNDGGFGDVTAFVSTYVADISMTPRDNDAITNRARCHGAIIKQLDQSVCTSYSHKIVKYIGPESVSGL